MKHGAVNLSRITKGEKMKTVTDFNATMERVKAGSSRFVVATYTHATLIDAKCLAKWDKAGLTLLKPEGNGYRMAQGKSSVFLFSTNLFEQSL